MTLGPTAEPHESVWNRSSNQTYSNITIQGEQYLPHIVIHLSHVVRLADKISCCDGHRDFNPNSHFNPNQAF